MTTFTITFELVTGKEVSMSFTLQSTRDLYDVLNEQWVGTTEEKVNMNHVTHYVIK
ncbi:MULTISPECIES: hypothetical protein [Bacillus]|uniref:hypothetical protein n=1 Tax=Bacillus TaxID=1386 RepID=UPI001643578F|nr:MULTISPECIES: hypothetical protein [Bacillus]MCL7873821.1 hypothetical protein [Bacillus altitudinis]MCP1147938.1 hypothetical protein [Bacillus sp. 1735sda2]USK25555.1 hypothetical protein LIS79_06165 [Bacillus altitudinis]